MTQPELLPDRHRQKDIFVTDIFSGLPLKDDIASMEHPIFSLSTKPDLRQLHYQHGNTEILITPSIKGLPTIFDKDILIYCNSFIMSKINKGEVPSRTLRISIHDLLVATNRPKDGDGYRRVKEALDRLKGVTIKTNIRTNKRLITSGFGIIDRYDVIESSRIKDRMIRTEITLAEWFHNSLIGQEVLTISEEYFRIRKPIERRLYELARKHCGKQAAWSISLTALQLKTGSSAPEKKFRFFLRKIADTNHLPDYHILFDDQTDMVTFKPKKGLLLSAEQSQDKVLDIRMDTALKAKRMAEEARLDFYVIEQEFKAMLKEKGEPESIDGAFIGFVKKKVEQHGQGTVRDLLKYKTL